MMLPFAVSDASALDILMGSGRTSGGPASDIFFSSWRMDAKRRRSRIFRTRRLARATQYSACMNGFYGGEGLVSSGGREASSVLIYIDIEVPSEGGLRGGPVDL